MFLRGHSRKDKPVTRSSVSALSSPAELFTTHVYLPLSCVLAPCTTRAPSSRVIRSDGVTGVDIPLLRKVEPDLSPEAEPDDDGTAVGEESRYHVSLGGGLPCARHGRKTWSPLSACTSPLCSVIRGGIWVCGSATKAYSATIGRSCHFYMGMGITQ